MWRCVVSYSLKEYGFKAQNVIFTELTCSLKFQAESKKKVWSPQFLRGLSLPESLARTRVSHQLFNDGQEIK